MAGPVAKGVSIAALVIGALECVFALIIIICSFVLAGKADMSGALTPYWAGIPFLVPGILGVVVGVTKNFCAMVAFLVLNIITFVLQGVGCILIAIVVAIWAAYADGTCTKQFDGSCRCVTSSGKHTTFRGADSCDVINDISTLLYVLVTFLVLASILALAGSIVGSVGTCCANNQQAQPTVIIQQQQTVPQHYPQNYPQTQDNMYNQYPQTQDTYPMK